MTKTIQKKGPKGGGWDRYEKCCTKFSDLSLLHHIQFRRKICGTIPLFLIKSQFEIFPNCKSLEKEINLESNISRNSYLKYF